MRLIPWEAVLLLMRWIESLRRAIASWRLCWRGLSTQAIVTSCGVMSVSGFALQYQCRLMSSKVPMASRKLGQHLTL